MNEKIPPHHKAVDYIRDNAPIMAKAKSERIYLEEFRKSKKALLMKDAQAAGIDAANAQEREAYANPDYIELIRGLAAAVEIEETIKWRMEAARMRVEIWRTESANNRMIDKAHE
jgi:hypothetical protein